MANKKKTYKYKVVKRTWKTNQGIKKSRVYVYKGDERVYDPSEIERAIKGQSVDVKYKKGAREAQKVATQAKKILRETAAKNLKISRSYGKQRLFKNGVLDMNSLDQYLTYKQQSNQISLSHKLVFESWLKANWRSFKTRYKHITLSSALGIYTQGGNTIQALYNTGYGIDEMSKSLSSDYSDSITASDLTDMSNWNGSFFTSPTTGNVYRFVFRYRGLPFELVSVGGESTRGVL